MKKISYISRYSPSPAAAADGSAIPIPTAHTVGAASNASSSSSLAPAQNSKLKPEQKRLSSRGKDMDSGPDVKGTTATVAVHREPLSDDMDADHEHHHDTQELYSWHSSHSPAATRNFLSSLALNRRRILLEVEQAMHDLVKEETRDRDFYLQQEFAERSYLSRTMFIEIVQFEAVERTADHTFAARFQVWYSAFLVQKEEVAQATAQEAAARRSIEELEIDERRGYEDVAVSSSLARQLRERWEEQQRLDVLSVKAHAAFDAEARVAALKKRDCVPVELPVDIFFVPVESEKPRNVSAALSTGSWVESRETVHWEEVLHRRTMQLEREAFFKVLAMEREEFFARVQMLSLMLIGSHPLKLAALVTIQRWWRSLQSFKKETCGGIRAARRQSLAEALQRVRSREATSEGLKRRMLRLQRVALSPTRIGSGEVFAGACLAMERELRGSIRALLAASVVYRLGVFADAYDRAVIARFLAKHGIPIAVKLLSHVSGTEAAAQLPTPHGKGSPARSYVALLKYDGPLLEESLNRILHHSSEPHELDKERGGMLRKGDGAAQRIFHLEVAYADTTLGASSSARQRWYRASPQFIKSLVELEDTETKQRSVLKKKYVKLISQSKMLRSLACNERNRLLWVDLCAKCTTVSSEEEVSRMLLAQEESEVRGMMNECIARTKLFQEERDQRRRLHSFRCSQEERLCRRTIVDEELVALEGLSSEEWMWNNLAAARQRHAAGLKVRKGGALSFSSPRASQSSRRLTSLVSASLVLQKFARSVLWRRQNRIQVSQQPADADCAESQRLRSLRDIAFLSLKAVKEDCAISELSAESLATSLHLSQPAVYADASWMKPSAAMKYKTVVRRFRASNKRELAEMRAFFAVAAKGRTRIARDEHDARETLECESKSWRAICRYEMLQSEENTRLRIISMEQLVRTGIQEFKSAEIAIRSQLQVHSQSTQVTHAPRQFMAEPLPVVRFAQKATQRGTGKLRNSLLEVCCARETIGRWELQRQRAFELASFVENQCHEQRELLLKAARLNLPFHAPSLDHVEGSQKGTNGTVTAALGFLYLLYWEETECRQAVESTHVKSFAPLLLRGCNHFATAVLSPGHVRYLAGMSRDVAHLERQLTASLSHRVGRISMKVKDLINVEADLRSKLVALEAVRRTTASLNAPKRKVKY